MSKISILVNSCDSYEDLWDPFFKLLSKYFSNDFDVYLNIEEKTPSIENVKVLNFPRNESWGKRFRNAIKQIDSEYIIILLDDFFLRQKVNVDEIMKCAKRLDEQRDIACFYFNDTGKRFTKEFVDDFTFSDYLLAKKGAHYVYNLQPALWRKEDLYINIQDFESPWSWEVLGSKYQTSNSKFYFLKPACSRVFDYGYNANGMGVFRGKWVMNDVQPLFDKEGIEVDYSKRGPYKANDNKLILFKQRIELRIGLIIFEFKHYLIRK